MDTTNKNQASRIFSGVTFLIGVVSIAVSILGLFWLSKILPGLLIAVTESGYSFMKNSVIFHVVWLVFFLSLVTTGVRLIISAIKKRSTNLVPGLSLYFVGAALVIIGLFYFVFQELIYAGAAIVVGVICIYFEGSVEII